MTRPNIIYIFADDMGYGDMASNNPSCRIPTPNLDRLAAQGMRFDDAHASTSLCTPSRYGVLTGRYCWRSRLKHGIVWQWDEPLIEAGRPTVASFLKSQGYDTVCFGKWHLGWNWPTLDGRRPNDELPFGQMDPEISQKRSAYASNIDFAGRVAGGPIDRGFDHYFGVDVPNFPPYAWFEDDRVIGSPTESKPDTMYGNPGPMVPGWSLEPMIPEFTRRAVDYIESRSAGQADEAKGDPFFIYFPLTSPHSPIVPNEPFKGMSGIGDYGDFVCEVDWVVGQVIDALERTGQAENTLLIFTSDNGPENRTPDDEGVYERGRRTEHFSMGPLRGIKRDAWEGGHRVPFVAQWPAMIPAGSLCQQSVSLLDLFATCAEIVEADLPDGSAEDSVSMMPLLRGELDRPTRDCVIYHSGSGKFAIREGGWVYIEAPSGGDVTEPDWYRERFGYTDHDQPGELFDLSQDLAERTNLYAEHPERVEHLAARLRRVRGQDDAPTEASRREQITE